MGGGQRISTRILPDIQILGFKTKNSVDIKGLFPPKVVQMSGQVNVMVLLGISDASVRTMLNRLFTDSLLVFFQRIVHLVSCNRFDVKFSVFDLFHSFVLIMIQNSISIRPPVNTAPV